MASSKHVLVLAVVVAVACLASLASATVWMVGDDGGWRAKFNQTGWTDGKTFLVGDSLMFMYPKENHTVAQVGQDEFAACNLQGNMLGGPWNTGYDLVPLVKPGMMWFICTKPNHCNGGMKLAINVEVAPVPIPTPPSPWFPFPGVPAAPMAPAPISPFTWWRGSAPAPAPVLPVAASPSAAVRNPFGGTVAAAAAAVVAAALAF